MKFHAFMYVTIGRRRELEQGMAGKNPVLYQRMLDEIGELFAEKVMPRFQG